MTNASPHSERAERRVSVVIPTVGRETLHQAIESALSQDYPPCEVLVVFDVADPPASLGVADPRVRVLSTGGGRGGNAARQVGVEAACGDAVALLDDDDYWYREKLRDQMTLFNDGRAHSLMPIISCGADLVTHDGVPLYQSPRRWLAPGQTIPDYLFKRREVRYGEAVISSSTLLVDRRLFQFAELRDLPIHQDWDWLTRASQVAGAAFYMVRGSRLAYRVQAPGQSTSRRANWRHSIAWADANRSTLSSREYGDFLLTVSVGIAIGNGARSQGLRIAANGLRHGRPGLPAIVLAASLLLSPRGGPTKARALFSRVISPMQRLARARDLTGRNGT
jgi:glycosyltransferase involved in cell wall biosynthesis